MVLGLIAGGIALSVRRARKRRRMPARAAGLRQALARMIDRPERVANGEARPPMKIATAAGAAAASVLARRLAQQLTARDRTQLQ